MADPFGRQTWTTIADRDNETMEWVGSRADTNYRARFLEPETEKRAPTTLDERLLRYLLCARALVIMRLASRGSQRIRDDAETEPPLLCAPSSFTHLRSPPREISFHFATSLSPRRIINVTEPGLPSHPPPPPSDIRSERLLSLAEFIAPCIDRYGVQLAAQLAPRASYVKRSRCEKSMRKERGSKNLQRSNVLTIL